MSTDDNLFARLGILHLDHLAVTTPELETTLGHYLSLPGARLLRGPAENTSQRVRYAFVTLPGETAIEILSPLDDSPIAHHLARGGGAYHLCYAVADLERALEEATVHGAKTVSKATPDPAFDGRRVAFLHHRAHGLFELVEAYPGQCLEADSVAPPPASPAKPASTGEERAERLASILLRTLPTLAATELPSAALGHTAGWDSATQLVLMMEIESEFGIDVPTEHIAEASNYPRLMALIEELTQ